MAWFFGVRWICIFSRKTAVFPETVRFIKVSWGSLYSRRAAVFPETALIFSGRRVCFLVAGQQLSDKRSRFSV
jgi:hypothetical protein